MYFTYLAFKKGDLPGRGCRHVIKREFGTGENGRLRRPGYDLDVLSLQNRRIWRSHVATERIEADKSRLPRS